jgi:hypothetical protein
MLEKRPTHEEGGGAVQITGAVHSGKVSGDRLIFVVVGSINICLLYQGTLQLRVSLFDLV